MIRQCLSYRRLAASAQARPRGAVAMTPTRPATTWQEGPPRDVRVARNSGEHDAFCVYRTTIRPHCRMRGTSASWGSATPRTARAEAANDLTQTLQCLR